MRLKGKKIEGPASKILVFPRGEGEPVKLEVVAVLDMTQFEQLVPEPVPPTMLKRGGAKVPDLENKNYKIAKSRRSHLYSLWIFINSLYSPAENLEDEREPVEWEIVDKADPETWVRFEDELIQSGFSEIERLRITNTILEVNSLDDDKMDEARNSFLASRQEAKNDSSSQNTEAEGTSSGEPANASE